MRAGALSAARLVLLGGATALAFFAGGYFPEAQGWAGLAAWGLVAAAALLEPTGFGLTRAAGLALGGLALLAGWTLISVTWAPLAGSAYHAGQLAMLYLGALLAATLLLREPRGRRWVEPALAAGTLIVIGYGIAGRLLPGLLHYARSVSAQGRLEQPLTYWNAMGELAALGVVLCARLVGDQTRPTAVRSLAAAASAPLGLGLYLSFSRGALFACVAGLVALVVAAPSRRQLRGLATAVVAAGLASAAAAPFKGVTALAGSLSTREWQGAVALLLLVVIAAAGATVAWRLTWRREDSRPLALPRRAHWLSVAVICAGLAIAIAAGAKEGTSRQLGGGAGRLVTLQSNRYAYWGVALKAFAAEPLHGVGAGGWAVWWLRRRTVNEFAADAHSLPLQTLAELGIVGLALLAVFIVGLVLSARDAQRVAPGPAAGPIAALVTYAAHAPLDWDWQMPAVTLVAMVLAGALLAQGRQLRSAPREAEDRGGAGAP